MSTTGAPETTSPETGAPGIELYWLPGCTACLRMKEFVEKSGLAYEAINLEAEPERGDKVRHLSMWVPVACVGDRCVNGHNLAELAELIGVPYEPRDILPPAELRDRYEVINKALCRYVAQMPESMWTYHFPNRKRPMLQLANHATSLARAFLAAYTNDHWDTTMYAKSDNGLRTTDEVIAQAIETRSMVDKWWEEDGQDDSLDRVVSSYVGHRTLHEVFEREVWHTAQHSRQLMYALELHGIEPDGPLTADDLSGLPLPERVVD